MAGRSRQCDCPATVAKVFVANSQCLNKSLLETCLERQGPARFTAIFQSPYSRVDLCPDAEAAAAEATGRARVTRSLGRGRRRHASPPPVHISDAGGARSPTKPTANEALPLSGTAPAPCPGSHCPPHFSSLWRVFICNRGRSPQEIWSLKARPASDLPP